MSVPTDSKGFCPICAASCSLHHDEVLRLRSILRDALDHQGNEGDCLGAGHKTGTGRPCSWVIQARREFTV